MAYRKHWGIPEDGGTAVIVQAMVFGNLGEDSGTGVLFSRDPLTGDARALRRVAAAGARARTSSAAPHDPLPLAALARAAARGARRACSTPATLLEREHGDVQDVEFTVERGELYLLQTRVGQALAAAAVRTAVDLAERGRDRRARTALGRVSAEQLATRARAAPLRRR